MSNTFAYLSWKKGMQAAASISDDTTHGEDKTSGDCWEHVNDVGRSPESHHAVMNSSREAMDLIGAFDNYLKGTCNSFDFSTDANKNCLLALLDLSSWRSAPSWSLNQVTDEGSKLFHSDSSAFSQWVSTCPNNEIVLSLLQNHLDFY